MTDEQAPAASTQLSLPDRARAALSYDATRTRLTALASDSQRITAITNPAGYAECHASRMALKNARIDIQRSGKAAREDAQKFAKAVIAVEDELVGIIEPEEKRLQALQDAEDKRKDDEKRALIERENERVGAHQRRIEFFRQLPFNSFELELGALADVIEETLRAEPTAAFEEFQQEAQQAWSESLAKLRALHADKVARAEHDAQMQREREQLAKERKSIEEQLARQREQEAAEAERRAADEATRITLFDAAQDALALLDAEDLGKRPEAMRLRAVLQLQREQAVLDGQVGCGGLQLEGGA